MIPEKPTIVIGADHAGFEIKEYIKGLLTKMNYELEDMGALSTESVDYPDYAEKVAVSVSTGENKMGVLACGTGIGASIAANKIPGIRAALVGDERAARLSRKHNDANVLVLGGRPFDKNEVKKIVRAWLTSRFEGGRHKKRIDKISAIERKYCNDEFTNTSRPGGDNHL